MAFLLACSGLVPPASADTNSFLAGLWQDAAARGVSRSIFDAALAGFSPSERVLGLARSQPERRESVGTYLDRRVTGELVRLGQREAAEWRDTLAVLEIRYGVSPSVVLAVWGMETSYGGYMGGRNAIHALASLAYGGYRADYFRNELLTALQIATAGHVSPSEMVGSWAGAMGHTQFMPTSFVAYAVDHNGDGRKDIWRSVPDALASTANYLRESGWRPGETWGYEVEVPPGFDFEQARGLGEAPISDWAALGVTRVLDRQFPRLTDMARLYMPAGGDGPKFLLLPNFEVIKRYNNANSYALAVGHLGDRILGTGGFATAWPVDDAVLTDAERLELQALLSREGYDLGTQDGAIGPKTRAAITDYQRRNGLLPDGHASMRLLTLLRR